MDRLHDITITIADGVEAPLLDLELHSTNWGSARGPIHVLNARILADCTRGEWMVPVHLVRPTELREEQAQSNLDAGPDPLVERAGGR